MGLKGLKQIFPRRENVTFGKSFLSGAHLRSNFRCDDHALPVPAALQPFPDDRLGLPAFISRHPFGINVSRIHRVESCRNERIQQAERSCFLRRPSEYVSAKHPLANSHPLIPHFPPPPPHTLLHHTP